MRKYRRSVWCCLFSNAKCCIPIFTCFKRSIISCIPALIVQLPYSKLSTNKDAYRKEDVKQRFKGWGGELRKEKIRARRRGKRKSPWDRWTMNTWSCPQKMLPYSLYNFKKDCLFLIQSHKNPHNNNIIKCDLKLLTFLKQELQIPTSIYKICLCSSSPRLGEC